MIVPVRITTYDSTIPHHVANSELLHIHMIHAKGQRSKYNGDTVPHRTETVERELAEHKFFDNRSRKDCVNHTGYRYTVVIGHGRCYAVSLFHGGNQFIHGINQIVQRIGDTQTDDKDGKQLSEGRLPFLRNHAARQKIYQCIERGKLKEQRNIGNTF